MCTSVHLTVGVNIKLTNASPLGGPAATYANFPSSSFIPLSTKPLISPGHDLLHLAYLVDLHV